jgi:hypothetical protein
MQLQKELGGYGRYIIRELMSFRYNSTGPVLDRIRDGKTGLVLSVTRQSAGLYRVKMRKDRPYVSGGKYIHVNVHLSQGTGLPATYCDAHYVDGSWTVASDGITFDIQVIRRATEAVAPAVSDPVNGDRIYIELCGSVSTVGTDAL